MAWWQLSVRCDEQELEKTEDILLELGALCLTISDAEDQPIYEPLPGHTPMWSKSIVTGLFDQKQTLESLYDDLVKKLPEHQVSSIQEQELEDQVWERAYLDQFKPTLFGKNLWICPSWHQPVDNQACNIILDPGIAFGTGAHPTTALCLEHLDQNPPTGKTVIDYGCGSGILAIAAYKLGASHVTSIDIDPQALTATTSNAERNGIDPKDLHISLPEQQTIHPAEVLIANILSGPLINLEPLFASLTLPGGTLLLSGILIEQIESIQQAYQKHFEMDAVKIKEEWCCITATRKIQDL